MEFQGEKGRVGAVTIVLENVHYRYREGARLGSLPPRGGTPLEADRKVRVGASEAEGEGSWVLRGISLRLAEPTITLVIGPNGSGKSTLLNLIAGLDQPSQGRIYWEDRGGKPGERSGRSRSLVGLVLQYPERQLFAPSVFEDVAFGPRQQGIDGPQLQERVAEAMAAVGLRPELASRSPFSLSSGEKRRVALAGVLALNPELLVLDEPTAGLDRAGRLELLALIRRWREQGRGVILATHDWEDFLGEADSVICLCGGKIKPYRPQELGAGLCPWEQGKVNCLAHSVNPVDPVEAVGPANYTGRVGASDPVSPAGVVQTNPGARASDPVPKSGLWGLDPRAKLLFAFTFTVCTLAARGWGLVIPLSLGGLAWSLGAASGISWRHAFRSLRPLAAVLAATAGLYLFFTPGTPLGQWGGIQVTREGLVLGGTTILRLGVLLVTLALLVLTSSPSDLADGLAWLLRPLRRVKLPVTEMTLALTLAMRFFPQIGEEAAAIYRAQRARGLDLSRGSLRERIQKLSALVVPLLVSAFRRADELAEAMEARGWRAEGRTRYRPLRFGNADYATLSLVGAGLAAILWLH